MTRNGQILRFDAGRGFGFIGSADGQRHIFFHVRDFRGGPPAVGMAVRFEQIEVGGKGPRAMAVQALAPGGTRPARSDGGAPARRSPVARTARSRPTAPPPLDGRPALFALAVLLWLGLLAAISLRRAWPLDLPVVLLGLLALNIATFFSYALDKSAAEQGRWRTPESSLHALALAGGWPAAWRSARCATSRASANFWPYTR